MYLLRLIRSHFGSSLLQGPIAARHACGSLGMCAARCALLQGQHVFDLAPRSAQKDILRIQEKAEERRQ